MREPWFGVAFLCPTSLEKAQTRETFSGNLGHRRTRPRKLNIHGRDSRPTNALISKDHSSPTTSDIEGLVQEVSDTSIPLKTGHSRWRFESRECHNFERQLFSDNLGHRRTRPTKQGIHGGVSRAANAIMSRDNSSPTTSDIEGLV